jgi:DeoR/GlpR family transcriptional regulator of sugar metabolism
MSGTRGSVLPDERRRLIALRLRRHGSAAVSALEAECGISPMTARRDLDVLERRGEARRTHGGAVLPGLSSREDSFLQRLEVEVAAKERLPEAALGLLEPGEAVFVDSSTTA